MVAKISRRRLYVWIPVALAAVPVLRMPVAAAAPAPRAAIAWERPLEVATGGGFRGPWRMNDSEFLYVDDPTVAIGADGAIGVAWVDQARKDVRFQVYAADGRPRFEQPVPVSRTPRVFSWLPRVLMAPGGVVHALWQEIEFTGGSHGGEIYYARSLDAGRSFGDPLNLSRTTGGAGKGRLTRERWDNGSLDLAMGPEGHLYAAWTEFEGALRVSRSTDAGARFRTPLRVAGGGAALPARGPSIAVDAAGTVLLAWSVGEDPAAAIHIARSTDGGHTFDRPRAVHRGPGHADAPKIAVDGQGVVHLVWADSPAGPLQRYRILYARSGDGGRTFEKPREISGTHPGWAGSMHFPGLAVDGNDRLYVTWELFVPGLAHPRGLAYSVSHDGGRSFSALSIVPGSVDPGGGVNGSLQGLLMRKLAAGEGGVVALVGSVFRPHERSSVWLLRGRAGPP